MERDTVATASPSQFRAARALLGWSLAEAARAASVSVSALLTAEGKAPFRPVDVAGIRAAFEAAGVVFTDHEGVKRLPDGAEPSNQACRRRLILRLSP